MPRSESPFLWAIVGAVGMIASATPARTETPNVAAALATIKKVQPEGVGNTAAAAAWKQLVAAGPAALLPTLAAFDTADPIAANWLRTAVNAIAENQNRAGQALPLKELEAFVRDTHRPPTARRIAYELLVAADPSAADRLLPGMLDDPSVELRRDAVARAMTEAGKLLKSDKPAEGVAAYQKVLASARDRDQVDEIAKVLKGQKVEVDLAAHFNFVRDWYLIAAFENEKNVGYNEAYPPEEKVDLAAKYEGKGGQAAAWVPHQTKDAYGVVDLNTAIGKIKGAVAYAYAEVESPAQRPVEIRIGSNNAIKVYLNGKQVFFTEEYHHGDRMDQYVAPTVLKSGKNTILVKVCQNEQTESWAQKWSFQLRICDSIGGAVPLTVVAIEKKGDGK